MSTLERAIQIATEAHKGQLDKAGRDYIGHPLRVMEMGKTEEEKIVGVLHDVVEDGDWTFEALEAEGFSKEVIDALRCVTKTSENENYDDFIERVKKNPLAVAVKINDLTDNMDIRRLPYLSDKDVKRLKKYLKAYKKLTGEPVYSVYAARHITNMKQICFAGGCFWGTEHYMRSFEGVIETETGYANGDLAEPTYQQVYTDQTGHVECVKVSYDDGIISLATLCRLFFRSINPLSINRQGNDCGTRYRTGIYWTDEADRADVETVSEEMQQAWLKVRDDMYKIYQKWQKKVVFIEIGCRSAKGCATMPWDFQHRDFQHDEDEQANFFDSCLQVFGNQEWFGGMFWWDWSTFIYDDKETAEQDNGFNIHLKKAEEVLKEWYAKL